MKLPGEDESLAENFRFVVALRRGLGTALSCVAYALSDEEELNTRLSSASGGLLAGVKTKSQREVVR